MSTTVMGACWPLQMPPTQKAVLISLADNANDHGECWPSIAKICERTCFGKTAVIDAIAWLEQVGIVLADRSNGRHSRYAIDLSRLQQGALFGNEPVRQADRSGKRTGPADGPNRTASRSTPVRQADTNRKEPSRTVSKSITPSASVLDLSSWPSEPSPQILADWLDLRKRKRAPITPTALRGMGAQLHRAAGLGYDVDAALTECVLRGWQGLNADWLQPEQRTRAGPNGHESKTLTGMKSLQGMKHGTGLVQERDHRRVDQAHVLEPGPDACRRLGATHGGDVD